MESKISPKMRDAIKKYIAVHYSYVHMPLEYNWNNRALFFQRVYEQWAILECWNYIILHPEQPPENSIHMFRMKMLDYAVSVPINDPDKATLCTIFSVAYDVTEDLYDFVLMARSESCWSDEW